MDSSNNVPSEQTETSSLNREMTRREFLFGCATRLALAVVTAVFTVDQVLSYATGDLSRLSRANNRLRSYFTDSDQVPITPPYPTSASPTPTPDTSPPPDATDPLSNTPGFALTESELRTKNHRELYTTEQVDNFLSNKILVQPKDDTTNLANLSPREFAPAVVNNVHNYVQSPAMDRAEARRRTGATVGYGFFIPGHKLWVPVGGQTEIQYVPASIALFVGDEYRAVFYSPQTGNLTSRPINTGSSVFITQEPEYLSEYVQGEDTPESEQSALDSKTQIHDPNWVQKELSQSKFERVSYNQALLDAGLIEADVPDDIRSRVQSGELVPIQLGAGTLFTTGRLNRDGSLEPDVVRPMALFAPVNDGEVFPAGVVGVAPRTEQEREENLWPHPYPLTVVANSSHLWLEPN